MVQTTRRWFLSKSKNKYRKEKEKRNLKKRIIKKIQITPTKIRGKEANIKRTNNWMSDYSLNLRTKFHKKAICFQMKIQLL